MALTLIAQTWNACTRRCNGARAAGAPKVKQVQERFHSLQGCHK